MSDAPTPPPFCGPALCAVIPANITGEGGFRPALVPLGGRPLLAWTLEAAMTCRSVREIVVVADHLELSLAAARLGRGRKPLRVLDVAQGLDTRQTLECALRGHDLRGTALALLSVATPFRNAQDVDLAAAYFGRELGRGAQSLVSLSNLLRAQELSSLRWVMREFPLPGLREARAAVSRKLYEFGGNPPSIQGLELAALHPAITLLTPAAQRQWAAMRDAVEPPAPLGYLLPEERALVLQCESDLRRAQAILGRADHTTVFAPPLTAAA